jgi:predicted nucleic-acid-binding protein
LIYLYESPVFVLQSEVTFLRALSLFHEVQVGFADCLILSEACLEELELVTFDKKLSRMQHCQLLVTELQ